jgi:hypothetical protein
MWNLDLKGKEHECKRATIWWGLAGGRNGKREGGKWANMIEVYTFLYENVIMKSIRIINKNGV